MPRRIFGGRGRAKNRHVRRALRDRGACNLRMLLGCSLLTVLAVLGGAYLFAKFLPADQAIIGGSLENTLAERRHRHHLNLRKHQAHAHHQHAHRQHAQRTGLDTLHQGLLHTTVEA